MEFVNNDVNQHKGNGAYSFNHGRNISICIPSKVRYVVSDSRGTWRMYHEDTTGCDRIDKAGDCLRHDMSMRQFVDTYTDGVMPPEVLKPEAS